MALSVASSSSNTATNATSVVVTKPTGLAEGDLMVAISYDFDPVNNSTVPTLPSGWTSIDLSGSPASIRHRFMYKEASSSDAAASNFTFSFGNNHDEVGAAIIRVTGDWIIFDDEDYLVSSLQQRTGGLIIAALSEYGATDGSYSGYTISGTNPTWTERFKVFDSNDYQVALVSAPTNSNNDITSFSISSGAIDAGHLLSIAEVTNASGTTNLLEVSPTFFAVTGSNDTNGTIDLLEISPTVYDPSGDVKNQIWANQSKNSTSWTNQTKS